MDFENWNDSIVTGGIIDTVIENWEPRFPEGWYHTNETEWRGLSRTTDNTSGKYAMVLSGFYTYFITRIHLGESRENSGMPIDYRPVQLSGDYKSLLLGNCDSSRAYINVYFTKYSNSHGRDTIGQINIVLPETEDEYVNFSQSVEYNTPNVIPDSMQMTMYTYREGHCTMDGCLECNHVFFDNLVFLGETTSVEERSDSDPEFDCRITPNDHVIEIHNLTSHEKNIWISDIEGRMTKLTLGSNDSIIVENIADHSVYFVTDGLTTRKIISF